MKKSIGEEKLSNENMISRLSSFQKLYDICFVRLNHLIDTEIQKKGSDMKTHLPTSYKNKFKK